MAIRSLLRRSCGLLNGGLVARRQRASSDRHLCMQIDVLSGREHTLFSAFGRSTHLRRDARHAIPLTLLPIRAVHALSHANICDSHHEIHDHLAHKDDEMLEAAAVALRQYIQRTTRADSSVAAAIVNHAPSFVRHLVSVVKQEASSEEKADAGDLGSMFSKQVCKIIDGVGFNVLQAVLESIGVAREHIQKLLVKLCAEEVDMQALFFLIGTVEKLGASRSSVGRIVSKDVRVLSYSSEEIEVGIHTLEGLGISKDELLSLIHRYPLVFRTELMNNINHLREELREFISKDSMVKKAVCDNPQRVDTYKRGCATEVVDFLKSYGFTLKRLDRILQKHGRLLLTDVEEKLKQNAQFLEDLGLSKDLIFKVINQCPNFLLHSMDGNLMAKLEYFKVLGFDESEFREVIWRFPNLFSVSIEDKIKPAVAELRTLGLSEGALKKVILDRPCLFSYKLGGDISALVKQLNEGSYPEDKKVLATIKLYSRSTEHKKRCEGCLVQYGLSMEEAKEVLEKEPGILGYSEHALRDKLENLTDTFGIPIQHVVAVPEYLSFSMRKRVQRRQRVLSYMKSRGLLTGALDLKQLVLHSNSQFYNDFVKSHSEDMELSKIWFKDRDNACNMSNDNTILSSSETRSEAQASH